MHLAGGHIGAVFDTCLWDEERESPEEVKVLLDDTGSCRHRIGGKRRKYEDQLLVGQSQKDD